MMVDDGGDGGDDGDDGSCDDVNVCKVARQACRNTSLYVYKRKCLINLAYMICYMIWQVRMREARRVIFLLIFYLYINYTTLKYNNPTNKFSQLPPRWVLRVHRS